MHIIRFSENIARLRHEKKITQEQLADFLGVTKASVSKWETKQSLPDILLIPQIAAFFDVSIDELLGYEPQLSREQMQRIYLELAADFATKPVDEVMEKSRNFVRQYYSCYPFLYQICCLWLNHFMLAENQSKQQDILMETYDLSKHVADNCEDIGVCNDAVHLHAVTALQLGQGSRVIEILEDICNPVHLSGQGDGVLIQAYLQAGEPQKANDFAQITMYNQIVALVGCATQYLVMHSGELNVCEETLHRIEKVAEAYELAHLNPNAMALFYYQMAIVYCIHEKKQEALTQLKRFVEGIKYLFEDDHMSLHGDDYFDHVDVWFEQLEIGGKPPRDKRVIWNSALQAMLNPAFAILDKEKEYHNLKKVIQSIEEELNE